MFWHQVGAKPPIEPVLSFQEHDVIKDTCTFDLNIWTISLVSSLTTAEVSLLIATSIDGSSVYSELLFY